MSPLPPPEPFTRVLTPAEQVEAEAWRAARRAAWPRGDGGGDAAARDAQRAADRSAQLEAVLAAQAALGLTRAAGTDSMVAGRGRCGGRGRGRGRGGGRGDHSGPRPPVASELSALVSAYASDDDGGGGGEGGHEPAARSGRGRGGRGGGRGGRGGGRGRGRTAWQGPSSSPHKHAAAFPPARPSLLAAVAARDVRASRARVLQALRFFAVNGWLQDGGELNYPDGTPAAPVDAKAGLVAAVG